MMTYAEALAVAASQNPTAPASELETLAEELMEEEMQAIIAGLEESAVAFMVEMLEENQAVAREYEDMGEEVARRG